MRSITRPTSCCPSLKVWGALDADRVAPVDAMLVNGDGAQAGGLGFRRLRRPCRHAGLDHRRPQPGPGAGRGAAIRAERQRRAGPRQRLEWTRRRAPSCTSTAATASPPRWWSAPTAPSRGCAASAISASITAPMASAAWSATSPAKSRTMARRTSGSRAAEGIVALLPLPGDRVSLVWSAPDALADTLQAESAGATGRAPGRLVPGKAGRP